MVRDAKRSTGAALSEEPAVASQSIVELGLRTVLCTPLGIDDRQIGVLYVDARKGEIENRHRGVLEKHGIRNIGDTELKYLVIKKYL